MAIPSLDLWTWFELFWVVIVTPISFTYFVLWPHKRAKPDGYVGFFQRPDGLAVHVSRVNGQLMVISEEAPGVFPRNLGNVTGRDLVGWTKLRATPDN